MRYLSSAIPLALFTFLPVYGFGQPQCTTTIECANQLAGQVTDLKKQNEALATLVDTLQQKIEAFENPIITEIKFTDQDTPRPKEIPGSRTAIYCALGLVMERDDDGSFCRVFKENGRWMVGVDADHDTLCRATCMHPGS